MNLLAIIIRAHAQQIAYNCTHNINTHTHTTAHSSSPSALGHNRFLDGFACAGSVCVCVLVRSARCLCREPKRSRATPRVARECCIFSLACVWVCVWSAMWFSALCVIAARIWMWIWMQLRVYCMLYVYVFGCSVKTSLKCGHFFWVYRTANGRDFQHAYKQHHRHHRVVRVVVCRVHIVAVSM